MNYDEILKKIIRRYGAQTDQIRTTQIIESKLKKQTATYADAENYAQQIGKALNDAFREYLPEALTDGRLYRAAAEVLVEQPMKTAGKDVAEMAAQIQQQLNEEAGIGIRVITPELNQDQIDGIVTGICNAESYEAGKETLFAQTENFLEGTVDDCVRENADFQYKAGLSPKIERRTVGNCCTWCAKLAGIYDYADVSDRGNDVFRRHKNCHCQVLYNPGNGSKRQNTHTKMWTDEGKDDRIAKAERLLPLNLQLFAHKGGDYRAQMYQHEWQGGSLKDSIQKFVQDPVITENKTKGKVYYNSPDSRYEIVYDRKGNYFRIRDKEAVSKKRRYVGLNGESLMNKTENGRTTGRSEDEYNQVSHFRNTD